MRIKSVSLCDICSKYSSVVVLNNILNLFAVAVRMSSSEYMYKRTAENNMSSTRGSMIRSQTTVNSLATDNIWEYVINILLQK